MIGIDGVGDMSEDKEGPRWPAREANTAERWGMPPLWSPWNFRGPKPNREWQSHGYRTAHTNTHAGDESEIAVRPGPSDWAL